MVGEEEGRSVNRLRRGGGGGCSLLVGRSVHVCVYVRVCALCVVCVCVCVCF
jgi:hypothetical protein